MSTVEESKLNEIKMQCVDGESDDAHAAHADELARAYAAFAGRQESNPAPTGETRMTADVVVTSEDPTG